MGSDIRGNANEAVQRQQSTGERSDHRADMIMLIHIPADRTRVYGISIMRDTYVTIPGYGGSKINAGLEVGGPQRVVDTVRSLLNIPIHHWVMMDFQGFKVLTEAVGGVDVNVAVPFTSTHDTGQSFAPGVNKLGGQAALEFVRERYAFSDGDYQRVRNQQEFVRGIMAKLISAGTLVDPGAAIRVISYVSPHLTVNPEFNMTAMASLAYALRGTDPNAAFMMTLPTAGTSSVGGQSIVVPDYGGISALADALASDGMAGYAAARGGAR